MVLVNYSNLFVSLQSDGTIDMDDSIGSVGTIYLRIPEGGSGQIQVESGNAMRTYNAKSEDGHANGYWRFCRSYRRRLFNSNSKKKIIYSLPFSDIDGKDFMT